ncbi:MAG TPA: YlxR family protein [Candidatus Limnocylindrales bacterium]|nr:YlxR family protein [Candidatus Limnocylindrales bacterium]
MSSGGRPVRTCVGCGGRDAQHSLLRVQLDERGQAVIVDRARTGRSAYVHPAAACAAALPKSRGLTRSLRTQLAAPQRLQLRGSIEERIGPAGPQMAEAAAERGQ